MATMTYRTNLGDSTATFQTMMENGFGIVTVMNAYVFDALSTEEYKSLTAYDVIAYAEENKGKALYIDTFKVANVTQEGPTKTVSGGQFSNPLIKYGKSARLEMQDALGRAEAIEKLCGGLQEWNGSSLTGLHFGEDFTGAKLIVGDSFFIDRKTGRQVPVKVIFYQFLPDSIFNLTQDAEGDATVFDMNGDLLTTVIQIGKDGSSNQEHGVFYSIIDPEEKADAPVVRSFKDQDEVNAAANTLIAGSSIKVGGTTKVIKEITESYDSSKKKVVYEVTYNA